MPIHVIFLIHGLVSSLIYVRIKQRCILYVYRKDIITLPFRLHVFLLLQYFSCNILTRKDRVASFNVLNCLLSRQSIQQTMSQCSHYHSFIPFMQVWGSMQTVDCLHQVYINLHNCFATNKVWFGLKYAFRFSCNMSTEVIVFPNSIVNRSSQHRNCRFCTVVLRRLMLFAYCMNITVMLACSNNINIYTLSIWTYSHTWTYMQHCS